MQGYLGVIETLTPKELRGATAAILANHAQHSSIIRLELGLPPVPSAFLYRRRSDARPAHQA